MFHKQEVVLTNGEILHLAELLFKFFDEQCLLQLPATINFCIQANFKLISDTAEPITLSRKFIGRKYGKLNKNGDYDIPLINREQAQDELRHLLDIKQTIYLYKFPLKDIADYSFKMGEMQALLPMLIVEE